MENKQLRSFKDLIVWQKAVDLAVLVYSITEKFPKSELYGITNQMRRSVVSISSNIAEGFKRSHQKEKLQFYNVAYASTSELESQIEVSRKLNFLDSQDYQKLSVSVVEVGKMIDGLIKSQNKPPKSFILNSIFFLFLLSSIFYILNPSSAFAAEIRLDANKSEINSGEQFLVDIIVHSEESLNAVEGRLVFPQDLLSVKEIRDGNSVINFWVERPRIESSGIILFSGITPGGFSGANNNIFSVVFEAKNTGIASVALQNTKALKNDGLGTETALLTRDTTVSIKPGDSNARKEILIDKELPEDFNPTIESDPNIFDGKYFLVFATQDKISGVDRYEVREGEWGWFRETESPYLLAHQRLDRDVYVKVTDNAGNERIAVLRARVHGVWWGYGLFAILIVIILVAVAYKKAWLRFIH